MGQLEQEVIKIRRQGRVRDALLAALLVGGMIAMGAVPHLAPKLGKKKDERQRNWYQRTVAGGLVREGLAEWVYRDGKMLLRITQAGKKKLALQQEIMQLQRKRKWDGRWRMVAFDLPERRRGVRDKLRETMSGAGFVRLQDSVWVYPHDCEEFMTLLKAELKIGKDALYAIVERLENDRALREHFGLYV